MLIITDLSALSAPLPDRVRHVLDLRRELVGLATFLIVEPGDKLKTIEAAAGFPVTGEAPPWEYVLSHCGVYEAPIITSDEGAATVLIVPDIDGIDAHLLATLRRHAELADPIT